VSNLENTAGSAFLTGIVDSHSKKRIMLLSELKRLNRDKREGEQER
jgi:hypothetical protein